MLQKAAPRPQKRRLHHARLLLEDGSGTKPAAHNLTLLSKMTRNEPQKGLRHSQTACYCRTGSGTKPAAKSKLQPSSFQASSSSSSSSSSSCCFLTSCFLLPASCFLPLLLASCPLLLTRLPLLQTSANGVGGFHLASYLFC